MFDDLIAANQSYAETFSHAGVSGRAGRHFALVTCMDSRIKPLETFGLTTGDAKIMRNAGARVTDDVLRSLVLATTYLGVTRIAIMQHTDCALAGRTENDIRNDMSSRQLDAVREWSFLTMPDPDAALVEDVERVRSSEAMREGVVVEGWRYDVHTGVVTRVVKHA